MAAKYYRFEFVPKTGDKFYIISNNRSGLTTSGTKLPDVKLSPTTTVKLSELQCSLISIEYDKKVFSPCFVKAVVSMSTAQGGTPINPNDVLPALCTLFSGLKTKWGYSDKDTVAATPEGFLGEDFFVMSAKPYYDYNNGECRLTLEIYSRDKLLAVDKYSRSYLDCKLGEDILKGTVDASGTGPLKSYEVGCLVGPERMQITGYDLTDSITKKNVPTELKIPYKVQYNEDFYSFVSRIACRYGEFLFFEGGKLTLGLDKVNPAATGGNVTRLKLKGSDKQVRSMEYPSGEVNGLTVTGHYRNYRDKVGYSTAALTYNEDDAYDEYFDVLPNKGPTSLSTEKAWGNYIAPVLSYLFPGISKLRHGQRFLGAETLAKFTLETALALEQDGTRAVYVNNNYKANVFDNAGKNASKYKATEQLDSDKNIRQFSSISENVKNLMGAFFTTIREREKYVAAHTIKLNMEPGSVNLKVGDYVAFDAAATTVYVVTGVSGKMDMVLKEKNMERYWQFQDAQTVYLVPKPDKGEVFLPPYNSCVEYNRVASQPAIVADASDPRYQGRVRIRYPWQSEKDDPSPWIRVVAPMATKEGGVSFRPSPGDEVMVNYLGGNVDRPYVEGSLFNEDHKPSVRLYSPFNRTIRSETGQRINFRGGTVEPWISSMIPLAGFIIPLYPTMYAGLTKVIDNADFLKKLHGIVEISDTYGFWTIKGDTAARSVVVDSLLGKVTVSALTGISIEAPHGDIKIIGKNIDIEARNNIRIESGIAIKEALAANLKTKKFAAQTLGGAAIAVAEGLLADVLLKKVDMSLIRAIYEAIYEPMEGTLEVKSNRFLRLEAGEGSAFSGEANSADFISKEDKERFESKSMAFKIDGISEVVKKCKAFVELYSATFVSDALLILARMETYDNYLNVILRDGIMKKLLGDGSKAMSVVENALKSAKEKTASELEREISNALDEAKAPLENQNKNGNADDKDESSNESIVIDANISNQPAINNAQNELIKISQDLLTLTNMANQFSYKYRNLKKWISKDYEKVLNLTDMQKLFADLIDKQLLGYLNTRSKPTEDELKSRIDPKVIFRKACSNYLKSFKDLAFTPPADGDMADDDAWADAVCAITFAQDQLADKKMSDLAAGLADKFKKKYTIKNYNEQNLWNHKSRGRILISEDLGITHTITTAGSIETKNANEVGSETLPNLRKILFENDGLPSMNDLIAKGKKEQKEEPGQPLVVEGND